MLVYQLQLWLIRLPLVQGVQEDQQVAQAQLLQDQIQFFQVQHLLHLLVVVKEGDQVQLQMMVVQEVVVLQFLDQPKVHLK
tara:strand:+ start:94 stop:336 length:243 start_codon:yes stop_codon:yes gene_type:complete